MNIPTTEIGPLRLETPIVAAASSATRPLDLARLMRTAIGAVIMKSTTLEPRPGNPEPNFYTDGILTTNAQGLPGLGVVGDIHQLEQLKDRFPTRDKPLILSIAGLQPTEYWQIMREIQTRVGHLFNAIELNLSCPNVSDKPIISYDHETVKEILAKILTDFPEITTGVKIAPHFSEKEQARLLEDINNYLDNTNPELTASFYNSQFYDQAHLERLAELLLALHRRHRNLAFVSATNTLPNCRLTRSDGSTVLHSQANGGQGGLSGDFLHPIAVGNVATLARKLLGEEVKIIGTGGVKDAQTAENFFQKGAHAVAVGTNLVNNGPRRIETLTADIADIYE